LNTHFIHKLEMVAINPMRSLQSACGGGIVGDEAIVILGV